MKITESSNSLGATALHPLKLTHSSTGYQAKTSLGYLGFLMVYTNFNPFHGPVSFTSWLWFNVASRMRLSRGPGTCCFGNLWLPNRSAKMAHDQGALDHALDPKGELRQSGAASATFHQRSWLWTACRHTSLPRNFLGNISETSEKHGWDVLIKSNMCISFLDILKIS